MGYVKWTDLILNGRHLMTVVGNSDYQVSKLKAYAYMHNYTYEIKVR